jgi:DNA polymerase-3 subunit delta'
MTAWLEIIGHSWAIESLKSAIQYDRVGHAYLITGPVQVGKTTLARTFAQALNCTGDEVSARPCGCCRSCTLIAAERHPDVQFISGKVSDRGKTSLKIDQIRRLQRDLNLTPTEARYQVAIITGFESATLGAANAFLKTLEEPPQNVVLLLTAPDSETLLPTISSRCRIIALRPLPAETIKEALIERWQIATEQAGLLAHLSDGRPGWAILASRNKAVLKLRAERLNHLRDALSQDIVGRFALADKLAHKAEALPDVLRAWVSWWRDLALLAHGRLPPETLTNQDEIERFQQLCQLWSPDLPSVALRNTEQAILQLSQNANIRLVIENLLLSYPHLNDSER